MSATFTPGPWDTDWWEYLLRDLHNFLPEGMCGPADEDGPWGTKPEFNYPGLTGHDEPNARLIAAAPELYEALKSISYGVATTAMPEAACEYLLPFAMKAQAALAKARGESGQ